MDILAISGSRSPRGQTARATDALLDGARADGAGTEHVFLPPLRIERCRQCDDAGWGTCRSAGKCVIEDDFAPLVDRIRQARAVVFATPVYFSDLAESLRALLDRMRRTCFHDDKRGGFAGKPAIGICVAGGGGGGAPTCAVNLEKILRTIGFDVLDLVPVRRQNLQMKLPLLGATGQWLFSSLNAPKT